MDQLYIKREFLPFGGKEEGGGGAPGTTLTFGWDGVAVELTEGVDGTGVEGWDGDGESWESWE